jgi:hypothetical protein
MKLYGLRSMTLILLEVRNKEELPISERVLLYQFIRRVKKLTTFITVGYQGYQFLTNPTSFSQG